MKTERAFRTYDEAFSWLAAHTNYETMATQSYDARTYGLARVESLLDALGRPDEELTCVQVVGSKGKGSTAACLDAILRRDGRRTGLFTSPHLVHPRERIRVDGTPLPDRRFCEALDALRGPVERARREGEPVTFFEILTAAALLGFRAQGCDAAVLEAGMGGRLDATTAARSRVKVLTNISLDHTRHLGRTRAAVASEKAAVARPGVAMVSGEPLSTAAGGVVADACAAAGAPLIVRGRDFRVGRRHTAFDPGTGTGATTFTLMRPGRRGERLEVGLLGRYQADNAALAAVAADMLGAGPGSVAEGLRQATLQARLQPVARDPWTFVDGAHSPASLGALARTVRDDLDLGPAVFVFGMASDKEVARGLRALAPVAKALVATTSDQPRASSPPALARMAAAAGITSEPAPDVEAAVRRARALAGPRGLVIVTGSLYLCGAFLATG